MSQTTEMLKSRTNQKFLRTSTTEFQTREEENDFIIEGYFAVFNETYDMGFGMYETIAPGAFSNTISGDVRALINHDTTLVLGRTTAHTLELHQDEHGLWGRIKVNPKDSDAMNLYERVKRGDVSQCSFGFTIVAEDTEYRNDDSILFTIREVNLYEVSCCTFPAYESTGISARAQEMHDELMERRNNAWRQKMHAKLKGEL